MTTLEEIREQRVALGSENFHSGIRFEYKVFSMYKKKRNTLMVVRTAASHSLIDIICWTKDAKVIMISCKRNGYQTKKELDGLKKLKASLPDNHIIKLAYYTSARKYVLENLK